MEFSLETIKRALAEADQATALEDGMTAKVACLLDALGGETLSIRKIMDRLGVARRPSLVNLYLRPALEFGAVVMANPNA